ncbi:MAG: restriction endonuclease subunit S [Spirochaetia bacterium]|nr:restriction endonuclease subunit S [Spirochaetia bacterium]
MNNWPVYKIENICDIKSGKRIPLGFDFVINETQHPYIRARDIKNGRINTDDLIYLDDSTFAKIKKYIIEENDIAITIVGASIGDIGFATKEVNGFNLTENAVRLTNFKDNVSSQYLFYLLVQNQYKEFMQTIAGGAAQPKLGIYKIQRIKVQLPPLPTQQKIASILSAYDNLIQNYKKQIEALQTGTCELYKEWFVRFRFPGYQTTKFENGIPEGWKVVLASELGEFVRGKNITAEEMQEGMIPVISAGIEPSGFHNQSNVKGVSLTISNSGANAGYLQINYSNIWAADCSYCNSAKHIYFYYELLNNMRVVLFNLQKGAAQPHVYAKDINKMKIILPPSELIETANKKIKLMHEKIYSLQQQITNLTQQRDLLLPRLMSGKLEVE